MAVPLPERDAHPVKYCHTGEIHGDRYIKKSSRFVYGRNDNGDRKNEILMLTGAE